MLRPSKADVYRSSSHPRWRTLPPSRARGAWRFRGPGRWENPAAMDPKRSWTRQPDAVAGPAIAAGAYVRPWRLVRLGSSPRRTTDAPVWRLCCFLGSLMLAVVALISPVDALADQLFFMHMVQHMLLLDLVPILAILGFTKVILRPATRGLRRLEQRAGVLAQ